LPSEIPHDLIVDISVMDSPDSVIRAGDLSLPAGVTLVTDPDSFIARVIQRRGTTAATSAEEATAPSGEEIAVNTNTVSDTTEPESSEGSSEEAEISTEEAD
jgi:hypothetical protein